MIEGRDPNETERFSLARLRSQVGRLPFFSLFAVLMLCGGLGFVLLLRSQLPSDTIEPGDAPMQQARAVEKAAVIETEANDLLAVTQLEAREINEGTPFIDGPLESPHGLRSELVGSDRERALDCLAAAAWYEAGNSAIGQKAVIQVVLNRARNAPFPRSICGVVFEGTERTTGCQFTFTCDGAMNARIPPARAWNAARERAAKALDGDVFKAVGTATHYHTDWVVPYWSRNLDKIAAVETHLFYRWRTGLGRKAAFTRRTDQSEPVIRKLAALSESHTVDDMPDTELAELDVGGMAEQAGQAGALVATPPSLARTQIIPSGTKPGRLALDALARCGEDKECVVAGYLAPPPAASMTFQQLKSSPPDFLYVQVLRDRRQKAYWNCDKFPRPDAAQCIPVGGVAGLLPKSR